MQRQQQQYWQRPASLQAAALELLLPLQASKIHQPPRLSAGFMVYQHQQPETSRIHMPLDL